MRLSNKVLLTVSVIWGAFLVVSYFAAEHFLMESFLRLENVQINTNIHRVKQALDQVLYSLSTFTVDWSHWNDAYDYMDGNNPQFIPNNMDITAFANSNINLLIYLNKKGAIQFGLQMDLDNKKQVAYSVGLDKYIYPGSLLENQMEINHNTSGLISLPSGMMLIAASGISYTDLSKPINGTLIAGRYLSNKLLKKLSDATSLSLTLYLPKEIETSQKMKEIYHYALQDADRKYISMHNKYAKSYTVLLDIRNQPIGMLGITTPRDIYAIGKRAIHFYLGIFFISGILVAAILLYLLRILVLQRLELLNLKIKEISRKKDYSTHIEMHENDELSSVSKQFNELMDTISMTHEQLKRQVKEISCSEKKLESTNKKLMLEINERKQMEDKVEILHKKLILAARQAGMADIASGVLHNVGNILNNVTTSVGIAKELVDSSRSEKLNDLAKLLMQHKNDLAVFLTNDSQGIKILDYFDLLAKSIMDNNTNMTEEISHLDQYISHIKDVIVMQQSLTSVIGMTEQLKISDVIDDALMLNKSISENKDIQTICDFQLTDEVILDRVKLLHVIVNLIKNAIESLVDSNVENKHILIRVLQKDDTYFYIEVTDNGLGILPENLNRIFNYGFTTKKTGNGIGLHTSASFIKEMGGKIYAKSEGVNCGATFVVELPRHPLEK
jgi:sensor domain CHASE-containing protein/anti-sigma regulatory factor (Ser/Thr protein kinase)